MEQGLSFLTFITLLMVVMFVLESPILFLVIFFGGGTYLGMKSRSKGWEWPRRP